jgi:hypothetical protein
VCIEAGMYAIRARRKVSRAQKISIFLCLSKTRGTGFRKKVPDFFGKFIGHADGD